MKLFLDDERDPDWVYPGEDWVLVRSPGEFYLMFDNTVGAVSLDHDLGMGVEDGYDVACWLEKMILEGYTPCPEELLCHSANPVGRARIEQVFRNIHRRFR